MRATK